MTEIEGKNHLLAQYRKKGVLAEAHRGNCNKGLVDNTLEAFEYTLKRGADILEMDVFASTDGELFLFHTTMEKVFLHEDVDLHTMSSAEIRKWKQYNALGQLTERGIDTLEDALKLTKDRCILNLDRCESVFGLVAELVKKHGMESQILLKSVPTEDNLQRVKREAPEYMYMPIQRYTLDGLKEAEEMGLHMVGVELTFDDPEMVSEEKMRRWHDKGYLLLTNSLNTGGRTLNAGHDDEISISGDLNGGWGWLVNKGFDIIQTDYADRLRAYLK